MVIMMRKKHKRYRIYSVRRVNKKALSASAVLLYVMVCAIVVSVIIASVSGCGKERVSDVSSAAMAQLEVSSAVASQEQEEDKLVSSSISVREEAVSSAPVSASSTVPNVAVSSKASSSAGVNKSVIPFDVYAEAKEWTYRIDKSKSVPLQPAVDNSFFADAMFVGDSITTGIDLYNTVNNAPVVAYKGINTNTVLTSKVIRSGNGKITFLQAMKKYDPKHIYIMMGINGIAFQSKDNLISGYGKFVDAVKAQHPNAIIYLQSILPVTAKMQNKDSRFANSKINTYNEAIAQLAAEKGVYYLNVAEAFKDGYGNLPNAASPNDGIHFGTTYYKRWIEYLKRHTVYTGEIPTVSSSSASQNSSHTVSLPTLSRPENESGVSASSEQSISQ